MTALYYGLNAGDDYTECAVGSSTTSKDVEIVIADITKFPDRQTLMNALENLEDFIMRSNYYPV